MNQYKLKYIKELPEVKRQELFVKHGFNYHADFGEEKRQSLLNLEEIREMISTEFVDFQSSTSTHVLLDKCDDSLSFDQRNT